MGWLYRFEAKGIQQYVLATEKLREIAGASSLVESLKKDLSDFLLKLGGQQKPEVQMNAAGSATIFFHDREALDSFQSVWPMFVARTRPGLSIVHGSVEAMSGQEMAALADLLRRLDEARNRPTPELPEAGPWMARSGRTGFPAVAVDANGRRALRDGSVDAMTKAKIIANVIDGGGATDALARRVGIPNECTVPSDINELSNGYVAVLHADGNGIGRYITEQSTRDPAGWFSRYREFSAALQRATDKAVQGTVATLLERAPSDRRRALPLRPIVLGGDDFTVIVDAQYAVAFAAEFLFRFEQETRQEASSLRPGGFTACAGIAIVKPGFPFHHAYRLSEELCKASKQGVQSTGKDQSALAFHRVTTAHLRSWDEIVRCELTASSGGRMFSGPWSLERIRFLAGLVRVLQKVPSGSVREWLSLVVENENRAQLHWQRMLEVLDPGVRNELGPAFDHLGIDENTGWAANGTPILDAVVWRAVDSTATLWGAT